MRSSPTSAVQAALYRCLVKGSASVMRLCREGVESPEDRRGLARRRSGHRHSDIARTSLERGTDGKSFLLEGAELVAGVSGPDHAHTAVRSGKAGVLRAVSPHGVLVLDRDLKSGEVRSLTRGDGEAVRGTKSDSTLSGNDKGSILTNQS